VIRRHRRTILASALAVVLAASGASAADFGKSLRETEGRRRAAENGLRQIKSKAAQLAEQIKETYTKAASEQNAWLDLVVDSVRSRAATTPDVGAVAERAGATLVSWVAARNRVLGEPELAGTIADAVRKGVVQDLTDIAAQVWKDNRRGDDKKRDSAVAALDARLRWKPWDQIH